MCISQSAASGCFAKALFTWGERPVTDPLVTTTLGKKCFPQLASGLELLVVVVADSSMEGANMTANTHKLFTFKVKAF